MYGVTVDVDALDDIVEEATEGIRLSLNTFVLPVNALRNNLTSSFKESTCRLMLADSNTSFFDSVCMESMNSGYGRTRH